MYSFMNFNTSPYRLMCWSPPLEYRMVPHTSVALWGQTRPLPQALASCSPSRYCCLSQNVGWHISEVLHHVNFETGFFSRPNAAFASHRCHCLCQLLFLLSLSSIPLHGCTSLLSYSPVKGHLR